MSLGTGSLFVVGAILAFDVKMQDSFIHLHPVEYILMAADVIGIIIGNLMWVAGIIFLPVPSVLILGNPDADALGSAMCVFTILVSQVGVRIQELLLLRSNCFKPGYRPDERYLWAHWITSSLTVVALALSIVSPNLGPMTLVLLLLARPLNRAVRRGQTPMERELRIL
ncbi:hypothetical protein [Subtercola frigoramans]|uniref:Uncharacterized protein n=1 Tax=Subtercola frigoramans TaxID=120298 RepID=A0ABS2L2C6_9MICO|nr:hypothetical protein [Subtercola frigoramans]MBM7470641.1 hypothetical protein [Subtercola frigoramans]